MKLVITSLLLSMAVFALPKVTLIKNVNIVDVENKIIKKNQNILTVNDEIKYIGKDNPSHKFASLKIINGKGLFAVPGLIDMHVHMDLWHYGTKADDWSLPLFVVNGVTTARDAGGSELTLNMKKGVEAGSLIGPRLIVATPFLMSADVPEGANAFSAKTTDEAKTKIESLLSKGYEFVKTNNNINKDVFDASVDLLKSKNSYLMGHPLVYQNAGGWPEIDYERVFKTYRTIEHSRWFFGDFLQKTSSPHYHTTSAGSLLWRSLAHADLNKIPLLVEKFKKSGLPLTPTLTPVVISGDFTRVASEVKALGLDGFRKHPQYRYLPDYVYTDWVGIIDSWGTNPAGEPELKQAYENEKLVLKAMDEADLPILVGTDIPARPTMAHGFAMHDEIALLKEAGVSSWGILKGATIHAAKALGKVNLLGSISVGKKADLVLIEKNPVEDISRLANPEFVMARGKLYNRTELDNILAATEKKVRAMRNKKQRLNPEALGCGSLNGHNHHNHKH